MTLPGFFEGTEMPDPGWWEALWPDPERVIRDVGIAPGMTVVDLCSGGRLVHIAIVQDWARGNRHRHRRQIA